MRTVQLLLFLTAATLACGDPLTLPIGRLKLLDGRTLPNAVIRSYDAEAGKVLVVSNRKAVLIPISLLPPPYPEKLKAESARSEADLVQTTPVPAPSPPSAPSPEPAVAQPYPPAPAQPAPAPPPPAAPATTPTDDRKAHQAAAKAHALRYYKYEFRTGSNAITVTDSDIAIKKTEPVPGWSHRFRTTGKIYLEIYDSVGGGSFRRRSNEFEILTEQKPGEAIEVVDFTRK